MKAVLKKVELKKFLNKYYFKITLMDINGHIFVVDKPFLSDPINFRKQVFGIMSACGSYDLMKFTTAKPITKKVVGYYTNRLTILENEDNEWFYYNLNQEEYTCEKMSKNQLEILEALIKQNVFSMSKQEGNIETIESRSGVFSLLFSGKYTSTFYNCGQQIYYGFGNPINIGDPKNIENTKLAAKIYTSFIVSLMKFYGIQDLLHFGGNADKLPIVEVTLKNNKIDLITNPNTGLGFSISNNYNFINRFDIKKTKVLK